MAATPKPKPPLPQVARICGMDWDLVHKVPLEDETKFGDCDYWKLEMVIFESTPAVEQETSMHECLHALMFACGTNQILKNNEDLIELVVTSISNPLWQMLRDNPKLVEYWRS